MNSLLDTSSNNEQVKGLFNNNLSLVFLKNIGVSNTAKFNKPVGVTVDSQNNLYVSDFGNNLIKKFDPQGNLIKTWGSFGYGNGQLYGPTRLAFDNNNNIYVTDYQNNRIIKFTKESLTFEIFQKTSLFTFTSSKIKLNYHKNFTCFFFRIHFNKHQLKIDLVLI